MTLPSEPCIHGPGVQNCGHPDCVGERQFRTVPSERDEAFEGAIYANGYFAGWSDHEAGRTYGETALRVQHTRDEEARAIVREVDGYIDEWIGSAGTTLMAAQLEQLRDRARAWVSRSDKGATRDE